MSLTADITSDARPRRSDAIESVGYSFWLSKPTSSTGTADRYRVRTGKKNGLFVVPGLGRLVRVERKARMGRNPATGAAIKIAAKKVVKFRISKSAKDAIVPPKIKK